MAAPNRAPGRHLQLRVYMIDAYKEFRKAGQVDKDGYVPGKAIYDHTTSKIAAEPKELEELLDTEGTSQNGGGLFSVRDAEGGLLGAGIKWEQSFANAGRPIPHGNIGGGVGEIGSPIMGANQPVGSHGSNGATPFGSIGRSFGGLQGLGGLSGGLSGLGQQ